MYDFIEQFGGDPAANPMGGSSDSYRQAAWHVPLVVEMPYWDDPRANDLTPTATQRRAALLEAVSAGRAFLDFLQASFARRRT